MTEPPASIRRCACPNVDPTTCWDLRYYGYSPATWARKEHGEEDAECACRCHEEEDTTDG